MVQSPPCGDRGEPAHCSTLPLHLHICQAPYAQTMMTSTHKGTFPLLGISLLPLPGEV